MLKSELDAVVQHLEDTFDELLSGHPFERFAFEHFRKSVIDPGFLKVEAKLVAFGILQADPVAAEAPKTEEPKPVEPEAPKQDPKPAEPVVEPAK